jgi:hypothetical protein
MPVVDAETTDDLPEVTAPAPREDRPAAALREDRPAPRRDDRRGDRRDGGRDRRDGGRDDRVVGMGDHVPDFILRSFRLPAAVTEEAEPEGEAPAAEG